MGWSAGLNAGANTVPWSGFKEGARTAAQQLGTTVGETPIGHVIETLQFGYQDPTSGYCLAMEFGQRLQQHLQEMQPVVVQAVIRNSGWIWRVLKIAILSWRKHSDNR